jgi:hypothetical protein
MKCPKCGYVSFDHHQVCPKCNKDVLAEQRKLNLPDYKPDPPFFLGALTGENAQAHALSASSQEPSATIEFDVAPPEATLHDGLSSAAELSAAGVGAANSSVPVKAPDDELELDLDELSLDLDEGGTKDEPGSFRFESQASEGESISLDLGQGDARESKPSHGGLPVSDQGKPDETLALDGMMDLEEKESQMGLNTAEMLTLELDRKFDAASSDMDEEELDDFEFDIDLDELKDVKE